MPVTESVFLGRFIFTQKWQFQEFGPLQIYLSHFVPFIELVLANWSLKIENSYESVEG